MCDPDHVARQRIVERVWPLAAFAAVANVIMQLGVRPVGYGVYESVVESGRLDKRPIKRGRTTFTYLAVAMLGSEAERNAYHSAVNRVHAQVNSKNVARVTGSKGPAEYNAFDPELQLWVAACLFKGALDIVRLMSRPPLSAAAEEEILRVCAPLATTLQVPADAWPKTMAEFDAYWAEQEERIQIDEPVRDMLDNIAGARFLRGLGLAFGWINRYFTAAFLPPKFREQMRYSWGPARQGVFRGIVAGNRVLCAATPRSVRMLPTTAFLWDLRRRMEKAESLV
ncbi:oxygenase MpaB family protein [Segniliparus rotundus]|nr:oxygenase MpaB family protein [Segniliparus rotundus]